MLHELRTHIARDLKEYFKTGSAAMETQITDRVVGDVAEVIGRVATHCDKRCDATELAVELLRGDTGKLEEDVATQAAQHSDLLKRVEAVESRQSMVETATPQNAGRVLGDPWDRALDGRHSLAAAEAPAGPRCARA